MLTIAGGVLLAFFVLVLIRAFFEWDDDRRNSNYKKQREERAAAENPNREELKRLEELARAGAIRKALHIFFIILGAVLILFVSKEL